GRRVDPGDQASHRRNAPAPDETDRVTREHLARRRDRHGGAGAGDTGRLDRGRRPGRVRRGAVAAREPTAQAGPGSRDPDAALHRQYPRLPADRHSDGRRQYPASAAGRLASVHQEPRRDPALAGALPRERAMSDAAAVDADGHITESTEQLRPYFEGNYGDRGHWAGRRSYYPEDGWDRSLGGRLGSKASDAKTWLRFMDEGEVETAVLFPTAGLGIGWVREPDFATALCRAYNDFLHQEFLTVSPRLKGVALIPFQDVPEAVRELQRAVTELGMVGAFAPAVGLRLPLGHPQFHPVYAEAERLQSMVACHATV